MIKALVTGAGAVLGQGIIRSLQQSELDLRIVAADPNPLSAGLFWVDAGRRIPLASDPAYVGAIRGLLADERPDVVLVGTDVELAIFAEHRAAWEEEFGTSIIVSSPHVVRIADDKYLTYQFLRAHGFNPPETALADDPEGCARLIREVGFPLIVKPRIGARSVGVSEVRTVEALKAAVAGRAGLVIQECVGDAECEYTASAVVFDGKAAATIVMRRDLRDGNTYRAYAEAFPALNAEVAALGEALKPYGPANFQFRTDREGKARVFEINARFSGATPLRALVGFNEVEMCIRHVLHGHQVAQPAVAPAILLRFLSETLVRPEELEGIG